MKKILLMATAVAAMASCAKTEVSEINSQSPEVIKFTTPYVSSKAADVTSVDGGVKLYAAYGSESLINGDILKYNTSSWGTVGADDKATTYYWPDTDENVVFNAYYPTGLTYDSEKVAVEIASTAKAQKDILAAQASVAPTAQSGQVTITMNHMLSKVDFAFAVANDVTFNLKDFAIVNVAGTSTNGIDFTSAPVIAPDATTTASYSYDTAPTAAVVMTNKTYTLSSDFIADAGAFMLLPQAITPLAKGDVTDGSYIKLTYSMKFDDTYVAGKSATDTVDAYIPLPNPTNGWVAGKSYKYTLAINQGFNGGYKTTDMEAVYVDENSKISFDVTVEGWDTDLNGNDTDDDDTVIPNNNK